MVHLGVAHLSVMGGEVLFRLGGVDLEVFLLELDTLPELFVELCLDKLDVVSPFGS